MSSNTLVQTRIDAAVKERAASVLEKMGMTVSDAVRILLTRTANEGALPIELTVNPAAYEEWFRAKVQAALQDVRPTMAHEQVEERLAKRRAQARLRIIGSNAD